MRDVMREETVEIVLKKIEALALDIINQLKEGKDPAIEIPIRSLNNVFFDEKLGTINLGSKKQKRHYFNINQARKFMQTILIASATKELIESGKTTSIRDLYYMTKHTIGNTKENTFEDQEESDPIIEDLEVTLDVLREELHLFASNRGAMVGNMVINDSGDEIDLSKLGSGGWSIPSIVEKGIVDFKEIGADYVLLVEKDAVWRRLNEDKFWKKHNCLLVHGQGVPPRGVRRLLWRLNKEAGLPIYTFVDNDPWGFYIYSVVKQGSINLAYESKRMAIPEARFLGLSSFDQERYDLPKNVTIKLSEEDKKRAKQILEYPWFQKKEWQKEIKEMLRKNVKLELEALSSKGISFVSNVYLPEKIENKMWL